MPRQRAAWLAARRSRGLRRPRPLVRGHINAGAASGFRPERVAAIIRRAAVDVDLLTGNEAFAVRVADVLAPDFDVYQDWRRGEPSAGSFVAVRRTRGHIHNRRMLLGVTAVLYGRRADRMRDRFILRAAVRIDPGTPHRWTHTVAVGHAPPKRNAAWWVVFMGRMGTARAREKVADWNALPPVVRRWAGTGRRVVQVGIDGAALARWIPVSRPRRRDVNSDHPAVIYTLWPRGTA